MKAPQAMRISNAFGYLRTVEVELLADVASETCVSSPVFVNVGAGTGTSGLALREGCNNAMIYTIDISPGGPLGGLQNERNSFSGTGLVLPTQILGGSIDVARSWPYGKIDLLVIDDNHLYDHVIEEIPAWLVHMRPGGLVAFHDYSSAHWPGVKSAIDESMTAHKVYKQADTLIVFRIKDE